MSGVKEAEFWLESAKELLSSEQAESEKYTVIVAQSIHSIIRANDEMANELLGKSAIRHDDAPALFLELIRLNKIPGKFSELRSSVLYPAVALKSKADYKGISVSKADAERWIKNAEKFLNCAKECLGKSS